MNEWKAAIGRITLFPANPASFAKKSGLQLFQSVWNADPDTFQRQENPMMPSVAQSKRGGIVFGCSVHSTRIDFNFGPAAPATQDPSSVTFHLIENARQLRRGFLEVFDALHQGRVSEPVNRVALNLQFLVLKPTFTEVNKTLSEVIPKKYGLHLTDEEDVLFQVNVPYVSQAVGALAMNAITKWSGARLQVVALTLPGGMPPTVGFGSDLGKPQTAFFTAASVTFEVNNQQAEREIPPQEQSELVREALSCVEQTQRDLGLFVEGLRNV